LGADLSSSKVMLLTVWNRQAAKKHITVMDMVPLASGFNAAGSGREGGKQGHGAARAMP